MDYKIIDIEDLTDHFKKGVTKSIYKLKKEEQITVVEPVPEITEMKKLTDDLYLKLKIGNEEATILFNDFLFPDKIKVKFPFTQFKYNLNKDESLFFGKVLIKSYKDLLKIPIEFIGFKNNKFIAPNFDYTSNKKELNSYVLEDKRIKYKAPMFDIEALTDDEYTLLHTELRNLRSLRAIAWIIATYFNHEKIKFPILSAFNTTGKGKTVGAELLTKITLGNSKIACRTLTEAQIKRIMSLSNSLPFIIDDYKHNEKYKFDLESFMRALFEGDTVYQATVSKEMIEFELNRPVIITGENPLNNMSSNNRMIPMGSNQLKKDVFDKFKNTDVLEKFGALILKERLKYTDDQVLKLYQNCINELENKYNDLDGRTIENLAVLRMGLKIFDKVLKTHESEEYDYLEVLEIRGTIDIKDFILDVIKTAEEYEDADFNYLIKSSYLKITDEEIRASSSKFYGLYLDMKKRGSFTGEDITAKAFKSQVLSLIGENEYKIISINNKKHRGFTIKL